jgi:hypothetical protein
MYVYVTVQIGIQEDLESYKYKLEFQFLLVEIGIPICTGFKPV